MPYKDEEQKRAAQASWRLNRTPAYHAWLYARRSLRFEEAERLREAIQDALMAENGVAAARLLEEALDDAEAREREVGNRFDHERDEPYYDDEAGPYPGGPKRAPPEGEPTTVMTVEWEPEYGGEGIRRLSRALAERLSEQPMAREVRIQTYATVGVRGEIEAAGDERELEERVVGEVAGEVAGVLGFDAGIEVGGTTSRPVG